MADFNIDVGFNVDELKKATAGASGGGSSGGGGFAGADMISKGFKGALMATGVIGVLASLKSILEIISFGISLISSFIGLLLVNIINFLVPFFKDPFRAMLQLGIYIINGILTGIEFLMNALLGALTFGKVGGFGENKIELPRFQEDIILEAYDSLNEVLKSGADASAEEIKKAQENWKDSFINSFLTNEDFEEIKKIAEENNISLNEALTNVGSNAEAVDTFFTGATSAVLKTADTAFSKLGEALDYIKNKAEGFMGDRPSGSTYNYKTPAYSNLGGQQTTDGEFFTVDKYNVNIMDAIKDYNKR